MFEIQNTGRSNEINISLLSCGMNKENLSNSIDPLLCILGGCGEGGQPRHLGGCGKEGALGNLVVFKEDMEKSRRRWAGQSGGIQGGCGEGGQSPHNEDAEMRRRNNHHML